MSGGSHAYAFARVEDMASSLDLDDCPKRRAFAAHLRKVAKAMHAVEWVDSGDYGPGDELLAIMEVIAPKDWLHEATERARTALEQLREALAAVPAVPGEGGEAP